MFPGEIPKTSVWPFSSILIFHGKLPSAGTALSDCLQEINNKHSNRLISVFINDGGEKLV
jgi:hypothetical protein